MRDESKPPKPQQPPNQDADPSDGESHDHLSTATSTDGSIFNTGDAPPPIWPISPDPNAPPPTSSPDDVQFEEPKGTSDLTLTLPSNPDAPDFVQPDEMTTTNSGGVRISTGPPTSDVGSLFDQSGAATEPKFEPPDTPDPVLPGPKGDEDDRDEAVEPDDDDGSDDDGSDDDDDDDGYVAPPGLNPEVARKLAAVDAAANRTHVFVDEPVAAFARKEEERPRRNLALFILVLFGGVALFLAFGLGFFNPQPAVAPVSASPTPTASPTASPSPAPTGSTAGVDLSQVMWHVELAAVPTSGTSQCDLDVLAQLFWSVPGLGPSGTDAYRHALSGLPVVISVTGPGLGPIVTGVLKDTITNAIDLGHVGVTTSGVSYLATLTSVGSRQLLVMTTPLINTCH